MPVVLMVTNRNARFQQWQALLTNRRKRNQTGEFIVTGIRPLTLAVEYDWPIRTWLAPLDEKLSAWAKDLLDRVDVRVVQVAPELLRELGTASEHTPGSLDLVAVAKILPDELSQIDLPESNGLVVVFDQPSSAVNVGTVIRSADAFEASGVIVTGHSVDVYDPQTIQASTGSLFAVPVVRQVSHKEVVGWAREQGLRIVGVDPAGTVDVDGYDLTGPTLLVIGNETRGMTAGWREVCDEIVRVPLGGSAGPVGSIGAPTTAGVVLYETARQRRGTRATTPAT
ncbi:TrmH family RNA methyltransferase [Flindersiella endophytica]